MKIINLFGAPGSGKSTTALGLTYLLKMLHINAEYVSEYAKDLVFKKETIELKDQFNIFAQQNNKLKVLESVDLVITDSPLVFSAMYPNSHYPISQWEQAEQKAFEEVVVAHFKRYPSINIFLNRAHEYVEHGRVQNENQANQIGVEIKDFLRRHNIEYIELTTSEHVLQDIMKVIVAQEYETIPKLKSPLPHLPTIAKKQNKI